MGWTFFSFYAIIRVLGGFACPKSKNSGVQKMENANSIFRETNTEGISESVAKAMRLWTTYAKAYQTTLSRYKDLLNEKMELGIYPLHKVSLEILRAYPKVEFLTIGTYDEAREYLDKLDVYGVKNVIKEVDDLLSHYSYVTIKNRVSEFDYQVRTYGGGKKSRRYGVNPDAIGNGKGSRSRNKATRE